MNELTLAQKESLEWIISILERHNIPFQISGGLAAKIYGSMRPLNDIDIDIPGDRIVDILDDVKEYITYGPIQHKDEKWDVYLVALERNGQEFDISAADNAKVHDDQTQTWIPIPTNPEQGNWVEYSGMRLPVMPKDELISYKSYLNGDHQVEDIAAVRGS
ncbi:MAG: MazG protein domain [Parcubacteria bacterium C7867-007]|nr:MAG: MazG protein domain [Parcubacteria bacterium C7867-007]